MLNRRVAVSPSPSTQDKNPYNLPSRYKFLTILGGGGFGAVLRCLKKDTQETVAVKIPIYTDVRKEASLLKRFMRRNFDQRNIVKFLDSFNTQFGKALVFEELDISLEQYFAKTWCRPMLLSDIRGIIRQTATAMEAMKSMGVMHTDIKPDNIMLVDQQKRPLEIKLIDFGLAMPIHKAKQGMTVQTEDFRAPEVVLGLLFTEAIDMWSLGCVMAITVAGGLLFSGSTDYELLQCISHLLGQPPDHLLNAGMYTETYFIRTKTEGWRFKTLKEYCGLETEDRCFGLSSLDDLKKASYERLNRTENLERKQCIELLKAMLTIDAAQRITPTEVLSHPFVLWAQADDTSCDDISISSSISTSEDSDTWSSATTDDTLQVEELQKDCTHSLLTQVYETLRHVSWTSEDFACSSPAADSEDDNTANIQPDNRSASPAMSDDLWWSQLPRPLVVYIQPAPPENMVQSQDVVRFLPKVINISRNACWTSSSEDSDCEPPATAPEDKDTINIKPDDHSPPPRLIYVRPATAENTWENLEGTDSLQAWLTKTSEPFVIDEDTDMKDTEKDTWTPEDSTACGEKWPSLPSSPVSELSPKKKKNCFQRFYSWMNKNFCSCMS